MLRNTAKNINKMLTYLAILFVGSLPAMAETDPYQPSYNYDLTLGGIVGSIYNLLFPIAIVYGVLEIIIAGYKIMTSEGEPRKLDDAKAHLTDSIIGIMFVMLAVVILRIIIKSFLAIEL